MGDQLGNYELQNELGRGGMGVVYKATDLKLGRVVAIKELLVSNAMPEVERQDTVERFRREAMAAARMAHPNIVTVYDYGQDGDRHYMAMELLEGKSLGDYLDKKTKFTIQQTVDISVQICAALDYAHQAGVVHRDIKPDNIMLSENGKVKLTDFGVARVKSDLPSMTTTGTTLGTIAYISPEQLCDSRLVDGRADIFSLGALIYEMLTFRTPFDAGNLGGTILNIMNSAPTPPREINPEIPIKLEGVVLRALKKNPEERYTRAAEMGHALQASLREAERPAAPKLVDPATRPVGEAEPCRHCGAEMPVGSRVCPSCGRASNAPLTYSIPTMPNRNAAPQPAGQAPGGLPKMPPPSGAPAARGGIPVMPTPNRAPGTAPLSQPAAAAPAPMAPAPQQTAMPQAAPMQQAMPAQQTGALQPAAPQPIAAAGERRPMMPPPDRTGPQIQLKVAGLKAVSSIGRPGVGQGEFQQPRCVLIDAAKNLLISDTENGRIQVFDASGHYLRMIRPPQTQESFRFPRALAANPLNIVYVTDDLDFRIYKFDPMGRQLAVWKRVRTLEENPAIPGRILISPNGTIYLSEPNNHRVLVYDSNEKLLGSFGRDHGLQSPGGMAFDSKGNLLVLDFGTSSIHVINPRGEFVKTIGKRGNGPGEFAVPREIAVDRFGNLFVADTLNHRIQVFDAEGAFVLAVGRKGLGFGEFNGPEGLAISADDKLYVADRGNGRIQVLTIQRA